MSITKKIMIWRRTLIASAVIVALILAAYIAIILPTTSLKSSIDNQIEAIRADDLVTAYSYTSKAFQNATSLTAFKTFVHQYNGLRNNENIIYIKREIKNGMGIVKATLVSRGGVQTPIAYQLVNENDRWKIESMVIMPQSETSNENDVTTNSVNSEPADTIQDSGETKPVKSTAVQPMMGADAQTYTDKLLNFSIQYPGNWQYNKADDNMVIFTSKNNSESGSTFTIKPMMTSDNQISVQEASDTSEAAIKSKSDSYKILEDGLLPASSIKNEKYHGQYVVYSYTTGQKQMKQLEIIYFKNPRQVQFVINFSAPANQFDVDLPAVKDMITSFDVD